MACLLDGCSFHYAHTWSKSDFSICSRHLVTSKESLNWNFCRKKTFFTSYVRNVKWATIYYKNHATYGSAGVVGRRGGGVGGLHRLQHRVQRTGHSGGIFFPIIFSTHKVALTLDLGVQISSDPYYGRKGKSCIKCFIFGTFGMINEFLGMGYDQ